MANGMKRGWATMPIAAEFPASSWRNVIRPAPGRIYGALSFRFDTIEHLYAWTQSETRRELVAEITRC